MARAGLASTLILAFLLAVPAEASHGSGCTPEECMAIVPMPDVPYLQGPVEFRSFAADVDIQDALARRRCASTCRTRVPPRPRPSSPCRSPTARASWPST